MREPIFPKAEEQLDPLEILGHPKIEAFSFAQHLNSVFTDNALHGIVARPQVFLPTFQKHQGHVCQGVQLHTINQEKARPWTAGQIICRELFHLIGDQFEWSDRPYEYQFEGLAIDFINGTDQVRKWVEKNGTIDELYHLEQLNQQSYLEKKISRALLKILSGFFGCSPLR